MISASKCSYQVLSKKYAHYYCMIWLGFHFPATTTYQYYIPNMSQTRLASHFAVKICKPLPEAFCTFTSSTQISRGQSLCKNAGRDMTIRDTKGVCYPYFQHGKSWLMPAVFVGDLCGSHDRDRFHLGRTCG